MTTPALVRLDRVSMAYGRGDAAIHAVEEVSLEIRKGEFIAVVGPSGCGKSSLMKRNAIANRAVELERLKLAIQKNFITPDVKKNGLGAVDAKRLERSFEQIALTFKYTKKPKAADIFSAQYLPPRAERMIK